MSLSLFMNQKDYMYPQEMTSQIDNLGTDEITILQNSDDPTFDSRGDQFGSKLRGNSKEYGALNALKAKTGRDDELDLYLSKSVKNITLPSIDVDIRAMTSQKHDDDWKVKAEKLKIERDALKDTNNEIMKMMQQKDEETMETVNRMNEETALALRRQTLEKKELVNDMHNYIQMMITEKDAIETKLKQLQRYMLGTFSRISKENFEKQQKDAAEEKTEEVANKTQGQPRSLISSASATVEESPAVSEHHLEHVKRLSAKIDNLSEENVNLSFENHKLKETVRKMTEIMQQDSMGSEESNQAHLRCEVKEEILERAYSNPEEQKDVNFQSDSGSVDEDKFSVIADRMQKNSMESTQEQPVRLLPKTFLKGLPFRKERQYFGEEQYQSRGFRTPRRRATATMVRTTMMATTSPNNVGKENRQRLLSRNCSSERNISSSMLMSNDGGSAYTRQTPWNRGSFGNTRDLPNDSRDIEGKKKQETIRDVQDSFHSHNSALYEDHDVTGKHYAYGVREPSDVPSAFRGSGAYQLKNGIRRFSGF